VEPLLTEELRFFFFFYNLKKLQIKMIMKKPRRYRKEDTREKVKI